MKKTNSNRNSTRNSTISSSVKNSSVPSSNLSTSTSSSTSIPKRKIVTSEPEISGSFDWDGFWKAEEQRLKK